MESSPRDVVGRTATAAPNAMVSENVPKAKRQKVSIACDTCRVKKIKCDGSKPVCGPCEKRNDANVTCRWLHGDYRNDIQAALEHIKSLEDRIKDLEQTGGKQSSSFGYLPESEPSFGQNPSSDSTTDNNSSSVSNSRKVNPSVGSRIQRGQSHGDSRDDYSRISAELTNEVPIAATSPVNAMIGSLEGDSPSLGIFGRSSVANFVSQVREAVDRRLYSAGSVNPGYNLSNEGVSGNSGAGNRDNVDLQRKIIDYELPSRERADILMSAYWNTAWPIYPFTDEVELSSFYESLWTGQNLPQDKTESLCMINVIFAMTAQANVTVTREERLELSQTFFHRARKFLDFWKSGSLRTVQCFLLFAQYLQSTNEPDQCWMCVGHAIRFALSLGLHLPETSNRMASWKQRELVRRVWHGCILMDRALAMTHGRPTMIGKAIAESVPLPLAFGNEASEPDNCPDNTARLPSKLDFYIHLLKLYAIMYEILGGFYAPYSEDRNLLADGYLGLCGSFENGLSILDIDRKFTKWERQVPAHLKSLSQDFDADDGFDCSPDMRYLFLRQAVVLRQRYLYMRILSLRPVLTAFVASEMDESSSSPPFEVGLSSRIASQCSIVCVNIAKEAIDLAHSYRSTRWATTGLMAVWWYNILFVYSAATVLIAARLKLSITSEVGEQSILQSWEKAMDILKSYIPFSDSVPRLVTALHLLYDHIPVIYSQAHRQQLTPGLELQPLGVSVSPFLSNYQNGQAGHQGQLVNNSWTAADLPVFSMISSLNHKAMFPQFQQRLSNQVSFNEEETLTNLNLDPTDFSWLNTILWIVRRV